MIVATPYLLASAGERVLENPTILEFRRLGARNYGAGLRLDILPADMPQAYGFLEWSHRDVDRDPRLNGERIFAGIVLRY